MDSTDKMYSIFWVSLFTSIVAVFVTLAVYWQNTAPQRLEVAKLEQQYKIKCIELGGKWESTDDDKHPPYSCKK